MFVFVLACALPVPPHVAAPPAFRTLTVDSAGSAEFFDIPSAIAAATSGDTIEVAPGRYYGAVDFEGKAVRIVGTGGSASTWLYASPGKTAISAKNGEGKGAIFEGFTVTGGGGTLDAVVEESFSSLTLRDVRFTANAGRVIIYARSALLALDRVDIAADNVAYEGWLIEGRRGMVSVTNSTVACGTNAVGYLMEHGAAYVSDSQFDCAGADAVQIFHSNGRLHRIVSTGRVWVENEESGAEPTYAEGSVFLGGLGVLRGGLAVHNSVISGGGLSASYSQVSVDGTVFYDSACGITDDRATVTVAYNLFHNNTANACGVNDPVGSSGNIQGDPLFVNAPSDFRLSAGSPAINAGSSSATYADLDGSRSDIGAFGGPFSLEGGW